MRGRAASLLPSTAGVAESVVIGLVLFCPLALGTIHLWAIATLFVVAWVAAVLATLRGLPRVGLLDVALFVVALFIGFQLVPLPEGIAHLLSRNAADLYAFSLNGLPEAQKAHPLSLDPPSTARELIKAMAYALVFYATGLLVRSRRRRRRLAFAVGMSGAIVAAIGIGHRLFDVNELFGLPFFHHATSPLVTTLGNRNNAAGLFCLTAPILLGLGLRGSRRGWLLFGPAYAVTSVSVFLTLSRGGMVAFVVGQILLLVVLLMKSEGGSTGRERRSTGMIVALALLLVGASVAYLSWETVFSRFDGVGSHEGKIEGFREALSMVRDFPAVGIGRGAFPTVGGRYLTFDVQTAEYVENELLQLPIDLGLPIAAFLLFALAAALVRAMPWRHARRMSPIAAGLFAGICSLAIQNLGDFSLELSGIAVPALVALAVCIGEGLSREDPPRFRRAPFLAVVVASLAVIAVLPLARHPWRSEPDAFAERASTLSASQAVAEATPLLLLHPASFVLPLAVAERFIAENQPKGALLWINKAMYLKPTLSLTHALAAQALAELGLKSQALLEARLFFENGGDTALLPSLAARYRDVSDLVEAVPDTAEGLIALARYLANVHRNDEAREIGRRAVDLAPNDPALRRNHAALLLDLGATAGAATEARAALDIDHTAPETIGTYEVLALAEERQGNVDAARAALEEGLRAYAADPGLVLALTRLELRQHHPAKALDRLKLLGPQSGPEQRAQVFSTFGEVYLALGQPMNAEDAYRNAARLRPRAGYELSLASVFEGEARYSEAVRVLREYEAQLDPGGGRDEIAKRIEEDDRRASGSELERTRRLLLDSKSP